MQKKDADPASLFVEKCKAHGLRITPQRTAIYREVIQSSEHPSADIVFRAVKQEFPNISFDTVNRTLSMFSQMGILDVVEGFGPKRFDPNTEKHHHLHCIGCRKIYDFSNRRFDRLVIPEEIRHRFHILGTRVVLSGLCEACRNA